MWWFRSPVAFVNARFSGIDASRQATSRTALETGLAFAGLFFMPKTSFAVVPVVGSGRLWRSTTTSL